MNSIEPEMEPRNHKLVDDDDDGPSWGGVAAGLLLAAAGIGLGINRYQQFSNTTIDAVSLTRIETLIYKMTGNNQWVLLSVFGVIGAIGLYLAISNFVRLVTQKNKTHE
ncbi:hypothetical protein [Chitinophaga vietnamensis]|uniref:hypothetical protein n=1 Tax=Chitinophaga vietnamensis TaxID=2593957 RepID=UPI00117789C1|nr:hypothetical protein [Chitinophaga vietnamensis]